MRSIRLAFIGCVLFACSADFKKLDIPSITPLDYCIKFMKAYSGTATAARIFPFLKPSIDNQFQPPGSRFVAEYYCGCRSYKPIYVRLLLVETRLCRTHALGRHPADPDRVRRRRRSGELRLWRVQIS